jgi:hypothetical protein
MVEITPLYISHMNSQEVTYEFSNGLKKNTREAKTVGGAVEAFAFSQDGGIPSKGIPEGESTGMLEVPAGKKIFDLRTAAGASSYAPGTLVEDLHLLDAPLGLTLNYWAPAAPSPASAGGGRYFYGDGGSFENIPLINYLQRGVEKIILFCNPKMPLQPASSYNPFTDPLLESSLTDYIPAYFGVYTIDESGKQNKTTDYTQNQVFASQDFAPMLAEMQKQQASGNGVVVTKDLVTVENAWWGIRAGQHVQLTICYLGRAFNWEAQLSQEMREQLVPPGEDALDPSKTVRKGNYKSFPHYETTGGNVAFDKANVLADLASWTVFQNADTFRKILS